MSMRIKHACNTCWINTFSFLLELFVLLVLLSPTSIFNVAYYACVFIGWVQTDMGKTYGKPPMTVEDSAKGITQLLLTAAQVQLKVCIRPFTHSLSASVMMLVSFFRRRLMLRFRTNW